MSLKNEIITKIDNLLQKADETLATHSPNPPNVIGFPTLNSEQFAGWQSQSLSFLINLLGENHTYVKSFRGKVQKGHRSHVRAGKGILISVKEDVDGGYLTDIRTLISAEVFTDFMEMAEHLLENNYKDPAASLSGAVLEDGLRKVARNVGVTVKSTDNLNSLNQRCADLELYNRLIQKKINIWISIRNSADHGKFDEYSKDDVIEMAEGINKFLAEYL